EEYDPQSNTWATKQSMPTGRSYPAITLNALGNIYVIGGNIKDPAEEPVILTNIVEEYNTTTNLWKTVTPFPLNIFQLNATLGKDNKIYVVGGQTDTDQAINSLYLGSFSELNPVTLDVKLLKQTDPLWKNKTYDNAQIWSPFAKTIERWGCALTSATMILNFHGINKLPNGSNLNPSNLNNWLKNQKDGYVSTGWVNWLAISRLSRLAKEVNEITSFDALEYSKIYGPNKDKLKEDIEASMPDIIEVPGHFVVAKGIINDTFEINDPFYDRDTLKEDYSNTFNNINRFVPSSTDLSYIMIVINPEIDLNLKSDDGTVIGDLFTQEPIIDDLNSSNTNSPIKILYFQKPTLGNYELEIFSRNDNKQYKVSILIYDKYGNVNLHSQAGIVGPNISNKFYINVDKENSNKSKSGKKVNFQTLIDDITLLKNLKMINSGIAVNLLKIANELKINAEKNQKLIVKIKITIMESLIKAVKNTLIKDPAYSILIEDLNFLKK
ncbi:MAG: C39 family peptidase, partial [Patescibacteria group bacterium]